MQARKRRLLGLDMAVYLILLVWLILFLTYEKRDYWIYVMDSIYVLMVLLICFTSLGALLHIAKRSKSLERMGIYADYTIIKTYVGFWLGEALCKLICSIMLLYRDEVENFDETP